MNRVVILRVMSASTVYSKIQVDASILDKSPKVGDILVLEGQNLRIRFIHPDRVTETYIRTTIDTIPFPNQVIKLSII